MNIRTRDYRFLLLDSIFYAVSRATAAGEGAQGGLRYMERKGVLGPNTLSIYSRYI